MRINSRLLQTLDGETHTRMFVIWVLGCREIKLVKKFQLPLIAGYIHITKINSLCAARDCMKRFQFVLCQAKNYKHHMAKSIYRGCKQVVLLSLSMAVISDSLQNFKHWLSDGLQDAL